MDNWNLEISNLGICNVGICKLEICNLGICNLGTHNLEVRNLESPHKAGWQPQSCGWYTCSCSTRTHLFLLNKNTCVLAQQVHRVNTFFENWLLIKIFVFLRILVRASSIFVLKSLVLLPKAILYNSQSVLEERAII